MNAKCTLHCTFLNGFCRNLISFDLLNLCNFCIQFLTCNLCFTSAYRYLYNTQQTNLTFNVDRPLLGDCVLRVLRGTKNDNTFHGGGNLEFKIHPR